MAEKMNKSKRPAARRTKKKQKKSEHKKFKLNRESVIVIILTLIAVGVVVFFAARSFGGMQYSDVEDSAKQLISDSGTGAGYPYEISSSDVLDMQPFKSNIALLTRNSVVVLNSTAKEIARLEHNYSDPDMFVYNGRALVYDRTTGDFTVMNSSKVLGYGNTDTPIYTAAMGKDGTVAFSLKTSGAQSELRVYNHKLEKIFAWECANEKIFDIAVSPNGKKVALALIGSQNAVKYSRLVILEFNKDNPVTTDIKYDDTLLFDVIYPSNNKVIAYSTDFKTTVTKSGHTEDYSFGSNTLAHEASSDSGRSAVVLYEYANEEQPKVVAFDKRSKLLFERSFDKKIYALSCTDKYVAVLFEDGVELIGASGETTKTVSAGKNGKRVIVSNGDVYVQYASNITKN